MTENRAKEPLLPFRKKDETFFNSNDVRDWTAWGYSYADANEITDHDSLVNFMYRIYGDSGGRGNRAAV